MDVDAPPRRTELNLRAHLPALVAYAVFTLVLTWPLAVSLDRVVPHDLGDPLMSAAILWWNAHHLPFSAAWWNGPFFFPATDTLTLSDHRVGLGLFATPLIWSGATAVTAYNITFLLTWWLSAIAAYALAWTLTKNRGAAFLAGCVFGFNPFRTSHLPHLELLAAYCLPIVLLALHAWQASRKSIWLLVLGAAWLLQALTGGYFFFFMTVFIGLWMLWFVRGVTMRELASLALALVAPLIIVMPVLLHYQRAHDAMGLSRSVDEIKFFSADVMALLTAPDSLMLWNTPSRWRRPEGELMPGLVAMLVIVAGLCVSTRRTEVTPVVPVWLQRLLLVLTVGAIADAVVPLIAGPIAFTIAGIDVSVSSLDKPLSIAFVFGVLWVITSRRFVAAYRSQSMLAFYCTATIVMWLLALGPQPRMMGHAVLYRAPYSLLMLLPGFSDAFRAPARFGMLAALAISVAVAIAIQRLTPRCPARARAPMFALLVFAVMAESWIYPFPVVPAPAPLALPATVRASAVVLELPTGVFEDAIATFHAAVQNYRSINGLSGYEPAHYVILSRSIRAGNMSVLNVLRRYADLVVVRDSAVTVLPALPDQSRSLPRSREVPVSAIHADRTAQLVPLLMDGDYESAWESGAPQSGGETLIIELAEPATISGVRLSSGRYAAFFARGISIDVSVDGVAWTSVAADIDGATAALDAALRDQKRVDLAIDFTPQSARRVRIRQTRQSSDAWAVAEVRVLAARE